jgi:single-strand DNA-binding protein
MNSLTLLALVKAAPTIKATMKSAGDKQIATFPVEVAAYRDNDPPMPLQVTAWGNLAADAGTSIQPGRHYVLTGRLRLEKNRPPELQINSFHAVTPLDAPGINIVSLVGRAGRDPEARYFESGSMVANLSLAVNRMSRDEADWFNLEVWGKQAQVAADYVRKGSLLGITGSFKLELWTDRSTGEERSKPVIRVDRLDLLGSRRDSEAGGGWGGSPSESDELVPF